MSKAKPYNISWVCDSSIKTRSRGYFYGDNPFYFATPLLLMQLIVSSLLSTFFQRILTPLGESAFISMTLAGFALGPSIWGDNHPIIQALYPMKSYYVNETFAFFGCILFMFVIGAKIDLSLIRKAGKKAIVIGFLAFLLPLILNLMMAIILNTRMELKPRLNKRVYVIAALQSVSSFHVIACLLADLKLLNSELGMLATSSSMISGMCSWVMFVLLLTVKQGSMGPKDQLLWLFISTFILILVMVFVLRPIMLWMIANTPEGKPIKEGYIFSIFVMLLGCAFMSEIVGQHFMFGAIVFGMTVPDGPPLGSAVVSKLESVVSCILLPSFFVYSISGVNLFLIESKTVTVVVILGLTSFIGKVLASTLPSLYCKMSLPEALSLGLIMSSQGIADVLLLQHSLLLILIDRQIYSVMVIVMVLLTGTTTPIIKLLYKPSRRYSPNKRRTIQHANPNSELRILACIYNQDYTPSIINLLEITYPSTKSPICCYVVHLIELTGRLSPLLIYHRPVENEAFDTQYSSHIINAFRFYERNSNGNVLVNLITAISPFASMHDEVCRLALDKRTSMVIIPFHRQWRLDGIEELPQVRSVNRQILTMAPCSVAILVDRNTVSGTRKTSSSRHNIAIIFIQGKDDREALAYAMRMAEHPNVIVTVIRVTEPDQTSKNSLDIVLDNDIIAEFKIATVGKNHHFYREEVVGDSVEMVNLIRCFKNEYDLILVGRNHEAQSQIFLGLAEWNEFPELGSLGDMLVSSDSHCEVSVLVVQQHMFGAENKNCITNCFKGDSGSTARSHHHANKVWPIHIGETKEHI